MGWCEACGKKTKGRAYLCTPCKTREKNTYKPPKVPLTAQERENIERLRMAYDIGYAFEKYFQNAMNSAT